MPQSVPEPPLLVITDRGQARRSLEETAEAAFAGGCRWLSLREKESSASDRLALLRRLAAIGARRGALVGVHGDLRAALAVPGTALHLPAGGDVAAARALLGPHRLIGVSAHAGDDLRHFQDDRTRPPPSLPGLTRRSGPPRSIAGMDTRIKSGHDEGNPTADYVTLSPIYMSASKPGYGPALGATGLGRAIAGAGVPVVALGGVKAENVGECLRAGAAGVAVMGGVMVADDPGQAVAALLEAMRAYGALAR